MSDKNNYIWIFGENHGSTADNNSYLFWKQAVNVKDDIDKYIVFDKNEKTEAAFGAMSSYEKKFVIWKNSRKHHKLYNDADMFFVTLSYKDITPTKLYFKSVKETVKKPVIYLRHGTTGMKRTYYKGDTYWNNMFRFLAYNPEEIDYLMQYNDFKRYQIFYAKYHPRYGEFLRKDEEYADKNQILWFITWREYFEQKTETRIFTQAVANVLKSEELKDYLVKNNLKLRLCVHQFFDEKTFKDIYEHSHEGVIEIVHSKDVNVMVELVKSKMLITDYSSVAYDFTFLNRPVLLYQPDLEVYNQQREFFCEIEDLQKHNITSPKALVDAIVNEEYGINPFFRRTLPDNIDYEYIKQNRHIDEIYEYFANLQRNKVTILGLNFYEQDDVVNSTMNLAESLLEQEYLVEAISLYRPATKRYKHPYGLNVRPLFWKTTPSRKERLTRRLHQRKSNYGHLKYDPKISSLDPSCGYYLKKIMNNIRSKTVISTRESTHLFLNDCKSDKLKNRIYFFHTPAESKEDAYSNVLEQIKNVNVEKAIYVSENDVKVWENELGIKAPSSRVILENYLVRNQISNELNMDSEFIDGDYKLKEMSIEDIPPEERTLINEFKILNLANIEDKERHYGICLANLDKYYIDDIKAIINFGVYLKENGIDNIKLDVIGKGDYSYRFLKLIVKHDLFDYINYLGVNRNIIYEIKKHDFMVDFSANPSYNIHYLQGVLNYKKVFCMENPKSLEIFRDIPNTFIESDEWLCEQINDIDNVNLKEVYDNYRTVKDRYDDEIITRDLIDQLFE